MLPSAQPIGELLIREGLIEKHQLDEALQRLSQHGGKTVENLIALGHLHAKDFLNFLAKRPGIASVELNNCTIPEEVIGLIPAEFARKHELVPIDRMGRALTVGMACPLDHATIKEIEKLTGLRVRTLLVSLHDIRVAHEHYYKAPYSETEAAHTVEADFFGLPTIPVQKGTARQVEAPSVKKVEPKTEAHHAEGNIDHSRLSEIAERLEKIIENPYPNTAEVASILSLESALPGWIVQRANNIGYPFGEPIQKVEHAVVFLGLHNIHTMLLEMSMEARRELGSSAVSGS
jgi:hypothetical protein